MAEITTPGPSASSESWIDSWNVYPSLKREFDVIDGLRGIAILLVVACHTFYFNPDSGDGVRFLGNFIAAGSIGVVVFFALSGYLISFPFWKLKQKAGAAVLPPGYAARRFWKIYPPLALSILLLTPVYIYRTGDLSFAATGVRWLAGLPLVTPVDGRLNAVMWTLIVEIHFYATLPLLFFCCRKLSYRATVTLIGLLLFIVPLLFRIAFHAHGVVVSLHPEINTHYPSLLDSFALGVIISGLTVRGSMKQSWAGLGPTGLVALTAAMGFDAWLRTFHPASGLVQTEFVGLIAKLAGGLLICFVAHQNNALARILSVPLLRWLGIVSYEWYLIHQPLFFWIRSAIGPSNGSVSKYALATGTSFVVSLLIAAIIYRFFSLPILRFGRGKATRGASQAGTPSPG